MDRNFQTFGNGLVLLFVLFSVILGWMILDVFFDYDYKTKKGLVVWLEKDKNYLLAKYQLQLFAFVSDAACNGEWCFSSGDVCFIYSDPNGGNVSLTYLGENKKMVEVMLNTATLSQERNQCPRTKLYLPRDQFFLALAINDQSEIKHQLCHEMYFVVKKANPFYEGYAGTLFITDIKDETMVSILDSSGPIYEVRIFERRTKISSEEDISPITAYVSKKDFEESVCQN